MATSITRSRQQLLTEGSARGRIRTCPGTCLGAHPGGVLAPPVMSVVYPRWSSHCVAGGGVWPTESPHPPGAPALFPAHSYPAAGSGSPPGAAGGFLRRPPPPPPPPPSPLPPPP